MVFLTLLAIPLLVAICSFMFLGGITWKEFLIQVGVQLLIAGASAGIIYYSDTSDNEVWNGTVSNKKQVSVPCSHSYQCNCHQSCSGSGKNQSCSQVCDTCYEHFNDWDWRVYTSNDESLNIERVDRRGSFEPPRWAAVVIGEPTSVSHRFTNYIKAASGTLFRHQGLKEKYAGMLPPYPGGVYDYYRLNRLVTVGTTVQHPELWNAYLSSLNAKLGAKRQVNIIVVLVKGLSIDYFSALEESWVGGKKNDVVLVVGVNSQLVPQWASVMAWTTHEIFKIKLRDDITEGNDPLTREKLISALDNNVSKYYKRKPMADFEYLKASITPTTTELVVSIIIGLMAAIGLAWFFQENQIA